MGENQLYTEKELMRRLSEGDESAFRVLYDQYRNRLYSLGMHLTRNETLSEEIVQDVFLKVWEKRAQLAEINYFNAWLRVVAKNTCRNYLRALAMERVVMDRYQVPGDTGTAVEDDIHTREFEKMLDSAIEKLPPQQKNVYLLSRRAGKKQEEIANEMNISIHTVKEYMALAQRSIRKQLEQRLEILIAIGMAIYLR